MAYRCTRKDEDYANYKEALNATTTEIRQYKRSYEQKLACNIKNDSKSFMHMSGVNKVQDKVGPLVDSAGKIISQVFLMVEDINVYFSSVLMREDISSLPVPDAKFQEAKSDYLGQLIVTPEMVAKKIKTNKITWSGRHSSKTTNGNSRINQYTTCKSVQLVIKRGSCSFEWKETNIIPLFKKGSRNKSDQ